MSEDNDHIAPEDEQRLVAAEYVLGVLDMTERRIVARQVERLPVVAREVEHWQQRLAGLADGVAPVEPPAQIWDRIEAAIGASAAAPAVPAEPGLWRSLVFWRTFAIGSAALAAASVAALTYVSIAPVPTPQGPMMATLGQDSGQPGFVAAVGADGRSLTIVPAALLTSDQRSMELWLIPPGDRPHSLGLIARGQPVRLIVPPDLAGRLTPDAVLAVSLEPQGGSPTGQPTGPVIANGKLTNL
jgi:anti-sigma-K factor RskA